MRSPLRVNPKCKGTPRTVSRGLDASRQNQDEGCQNSASRCEGKISEEIGRHANLQALSEDHKQKGKMGHKRNHGNIEAGTGEDANLDEQFVSQTCFFQENTPLDNHNSVCEICKVGGELLCCDGKDCLLTYHLSCLDPPLDEVPPGDWFCPACIYKKKICNLLSVCPVVESIWDMKESYIIIDAPCDGITTRDASNQVQWKAYSQSKHFAEAEHGSSMPTARKDSLSESTVIPSKSLASVSLCAFKTVDSDGYRMNSERESKREKLYFVKYKGLSHVHNRWIKESQIMKEAPKQLSTFKKKVQQGTALKWNPQWNEPHRLIGKRILMPSEHPLEECDDLFNCKAEWLVKWKGLGYDQCTWEQEGLNILGSTSASELMKAYEQRSKEAKQRAFPGREIKAKKLRDATNVNLRELPEWIERGNNLCHQLKSINKLRKFWQTHQNAIIIDEVNQERILTAITFILLLIKEFEVVRPIIVVASSMTISSWEDELLRCDTLVNFVVYNGNRNSREVIRKQEFYEESGCMKVQIILTTCDIVIGDLEYLKHIEWEALIVDEFQRINTPKSLCHLEKLLVDFRLVLFSETPKESSFDVSHLLSFLTMDQERKGEITKEKKSLTKYIIYEHKTDNISGVKLMEHWVPVELTNVQIEQYCSTLVRSSDLLCFLSKTSDYVDRLRDLLLSLRKCCNHPYLVDPSLESSLTKRFPERECYDVGINASGKLQLLDNVLSKIKLNAQRLLIIFQTFVQPGRASIGDILDDHLRQRLGAGSYERVDGGLAPAKKQAALQRFNCKDSGRLVFLLEKRACGPNIKLSSIDIVIIFDSDWNPLNDLRALQKAHIDTKVEHLKVFRLYSPYTVEERLLIAAKQDIELDNNMENFNATVCQQLLRWGVAHQFQNHDNLLGLDSPLFSSKWLSSNENLKILVEGMLGNILSGPNLDDTLWNSLVPRVSRTHGYGKGILLFGESKDLLIEEGKIASNVFWTNLLNARYVDPECPSRRHQRLKKKVQYSERSSSRSEFELADTQVKTKRRKVGDTLDPISISSWIRDAKKTLSSKKERDEKAIDRHPSIADQLSHESTESGNSNCKDKNIFTALQSGERPSLSSTSCDVFKEVSGSDVETISKTSYRKTAHFTPNSSLSAKNTNLMAEDICTENHESMDVYVQKQQPEQTELNEFFDRNTDKQKISNTEMTVKQTEKEKVNAQNYAELSQLLPRSSDHLKARQDSDREEENGRHRSIVKDTTAETVPSQSSSGVNLVLSADFSYIPPPELAQNRMDSVCRVSSSLHIDQSSQGHVPNFLQECILNNLNSSQQYLPAPLAEIREQGQQAPEFSGFTDNLTSIQSQQFNYMNISESQDQSQNLNHTISVSQVATHIRPSQPLQSHIMAVGSTVASETVAVTLEPSTMNLTLSRSPSAPFSHHSLQIETSSSPRLLQPNFADPLFREMVRLKEEHERIKKLHQEELTQIKTQFRKEFEALKNKYDGLLQERQLSFEEKKKNLEAILVKVSLNQSFSEMIRVFIRQQNNLMLSESATQCQESDQHTTHASGERMSQMSYLTTCSGVSVNIPDTFTSARGVQASGILASQVSGVSNGIHEGKVGSNANPPRFGSSVCSGIPVFQTPADSIIHVLAPPTSIAGVTTNSGNQVPTLTVSSTPTLNVTKFQPDFQFNLHVNSIARHIQQGIGEKHSRNCEFASGASISPFITSQGQIEHPQSATVPPLQVNYTSDSNEIANVIYLSDDD